MLSGHLLRLADPPKLADDVQVASFNAVLLTSALTALCLRHDDLAQRDNSDGFHDYNFWSQHYQIDDCIKQLSLYSLNALTQPQFSVSPNASFARVALKGLFIFFHQTAIRYSQKHEVQEGITAESPMLCLRAALEITDLVRQASYFNTAKVQCLLILLSHESCYRDCVRFPL